MARVSLHVVQHFFFQQGKAYRQCFALALTLRLFAPACLRLPTLFQRDIFALGVMMVELFADGHTLFMPEAVRDEVELKKRWVTTVNARVFLRPTDRRMIAAVSHNSTALGC